MDYDCVFSARDAGWVVEAIDFDNDGIVYRALFTGPSAEQRAKEYADWKRAANGPLQHRSEPRKFAA